MFTGPREFIVAPRDPKDGRGPWHMVADDVDAAFRRATARNGAFAGYARYELMIAHVGNINRRHDQDIIPGEGGVQ